MKQHLVALLALCLVSGCAGHGGNGTALDTDEDYSSIATQRTADPLYNAARMVLDDVDKPLQVRDPFEAFNRSMYRLNANLDRVLLPAVALYERFIPNFARQGVTNFFDNLDTIRTGFNQVLQLRPRRALETTGRLITNSTLGLAGLFDVASRTGQRKYDEDFGQTLGRYGVGPGPYLVLPLFGPSGLRDGVGRIFDAGVLSQLDPLSLEGSAGRQAAYYPLLIIDTRATTAFEYYSTGSPFEYELLRLLYSKKRELDIAK